MKLGIAQRDESSAMTSVSALIREEREREEAARIEAAQWLEQQRQLEIARIAEQRRSEAATAERLQAAQRQDEEEQHRIALRRLADRREWMEQLSAPYKASLAVFSERMNAAHAELRGMAATRGVLRNAIAALGIIAVLLAVLTYGMYNAGRNTASAAAVHVRQLEGDLTAAGARNHQLQQELAAAQAAPAVAPSPTLPAPLNTKNKGADPRGVSRGAAPARAAATAAPCNCTPGDPVCSCL